MSGYAYCQFCDDIRFEVGNKVSLMGVYTGDLFVQELPTVLPKLCVAVAYVTHPLARPTDLLSFRVSNSEATLQEVTLPIQEMHRMETAEGQVPHDPPFQAIYGVYMVLCPFVADRETTLTVVAIADGDEFIASKIRIRKAPVDVPSTSAS